MQTQDFLAPNELALLLRPRPNRYELLGNRNQVIIGLLVHQALIIREIGALRVVDIDLKAATVQVPATSKTEGRKLRLDAAQVMVLHAYLNEDRPQLLRTKTDHLILTSRGTAERGKGCIIWSKPYENWFQASD